MTGVGASIGAHGEVTREGKQGEGEEGEGGTARGRDMGRPARGGTMGRACGRCFPTRAAATCSRLAVHEKQEGGRRKERKKKKKEKKRKNMEIF
jgi:hypothetical protein